MNNKTGDKFNHMRYPTFFLARKEYNLFKKYGILPLQIEQFYYVKYNNEENRKIGLQHRFISLITI